MMSNPLIAPSISFGVSRVHRGAVLVVLNSIMMNSGNSLSISSSDNGLNLGYANLFICENLHLILSLL